VIDTHPASEADGIQKHEHASQGILKKNQTQSQYQHVDSLRQRPSVLQILRETL
jgi:hypothetical protein